MPPASWGVAEKARAVGAVSVFHAAAVDSWPSVAAAPPMLASSVCTSSPGSGAAKVRGDAASCSTMIGVASTEASSYPKSISFVTLKRSWSSAPEARYGSAASGTTWSSPPAS